MKLGIASYLLSLSIYNRSSMRTLAYLYTDPGSGALLWQLLVAAFIGALFYARLFIRRMGEIIFRKGGSRQNEQGAADRSARTTSNRDSLP